MSQNKVFRSGWQLLLWLLCVWTAAWLLLRLIPPFVSPDEGAHITRADMLAHGQLLLRPAPAGMPNEFGGSGGLVDKNLYHVILHSAQLLFPGNPLPAQLAAPAQLQHLDSFEKLRHVARETTWAQQDVFAPASGTGYYLPLIYLPHAIALKLGQKLDISLMATYDLVRFVILTLCAILVIAAVRLITFSPLAVGLLITPMALFQWLSPTIDGLTTALTLCAIGLFFVEHEASKTSSWRLSALAFSILLVATTRTHMLPLLALPIYLAWRQRTPASAFWAVLPTVASVAWVLFAITHTIDTRTIRSHTSAELLKIYLSHPSEFFALLARTLSDDVTQAFYAQSFIGNLGSLDAPLTPEHSRWLYIGLGGLCLFSVPGFWVNRHQSQGPRLVLLSLAVACLLLIFVALAITWSTYPTSLITGVQGRYFILPALLAVFAIQGPQIRPRNGRVTTSPWDRMGRLGLWLYLAFALYAMSTTLLQRYHLTPL